VGPPPTRGFVRGGGKNPPQGGSAGQMYSKRPPLGKKPPLVGYKKKRPLHRVDVEGGLRVRRLRNTKRISKKRRGKKSSPEDVPKKARPWETELLFWLKRKKTDVHGKKGDSHNNKDLEGRRGTDAAHAVNRKTFALLRGKICGPKEKKLKNVSPAEGRGRGPRHTCWASSREKPKKESCDQTR